MRSIIFGASIAGLAADPAAADNYRYVTKVDDGSAVFLDEDSVVRSPASVAYWIIQIDGGFLHDRHSRFVYYVMRQVIDCDTQMMRSTAVSFYGPTGTRVASDDKGDEASSIEPGTIEQSLYNSMCRNLPASDAVVTADSPLALARQFRLAIKGNATK